MASARRAARALSSSIEVAACRCARSSRTPTRISSSTVTTSVTLCSWSAGGAPTVLAEAHHRHHPAGDRPERHDPEARRAASRSSARTTATAPTIDAHEHDRDRGPRGWGVTVLGCHDDSSSARPATPRRWQPATGGRAVRAIVAGQVVGSSPRSRASHWPPGRRASRPGRRTGSTSPASADPAHVVRAPATATSSRPAGTATATRCP